MVVVVTTARRVNLQSNHHHQQTNTQFFFLPSNQQCQSTEGKAAANKYTHQKKNREMNRQTSPPSGLNGDNIYPLDQQPLASGGTDEPNLTAIKDNVKENHNNNSYCNRINHSLVASYE